MSPAELQRLATRLLETIGEAGNLSVSLTGQGEEYVIEVLDLAVAPSRLVASGKAPTYWGAAADVVANLLEPVLADGVTPCQASWHRIGGFVSQCRLRAGHHGPHAHGRLELELELVAGDADDTPPHGLERPSLAELDPAV